MKTEMKVKRNTYSEFIEFELQDVVAANVKRCITESGLSIDEICTLIYKDNRRFFCPMLN